MTEVEYPANRALHERYHDRRRADHRRSPTRRRARASFVGAFAATDLWNALAELRAS